MEKTLTQVFLAVGVGVGTQQVAQVSRVARVAQATLKFGSIHNESS